jgi:hypothetical protein
MFDEPNRCLSSAHPCLFSVLLVEYNEGFETGEMGESERHKKKEEPIYI